MAAELRVQRRLKKRNNKKSHAVAAAALHCLSLAVNVGVLAFVVVRFIMKLFKTVNNEIICECCSYLKSALPSELLDNQRVKFPPKIMLCTGILHYFGITI